MASTFFTDFSHAQGGGTTIAPQASGAQASYALAGSGVDLLQTDGAIALWVSVGATAGAPASFSVDVKLQHSDDNSTFVDMTGGIDGDAIATVTAANSDAYVTTIQRGKRYVRAVATVAFSGGTSPTVGIMAGIVARKKITGTGDGHQG